MSGIALILSKKRWKSVIYKQIKETTLGTAHYQLCNTGLKNNTKTSLLRKKPGLSRTGFDITVLIILCKNFDETRNLRLLFKNEFID